MKKWLIFLLISISSIACDDELKPADEGAFFDSTSVLTSIANNHISWFWFSR